MTIAIRAVTRGDDAAIGRIFSAVIAGGDTYAFAPDTPASVGIDYFSGDADGHVAVDADGRVVGMYRLVANRVGLGDHVANASYTVAPDAHGRGIGRLLGEHSLERARARGFRAMQFNFVVGTNAGAVALWRKLGFAIVGTLPAAFRHATLGPVDAHVMHRFL